MEIMKLYRFSPIASEAELLQAIEYMHAECNKLVFQTFGRYLPVRGCIGVFTHYDDEFESLTELRKRLTAPQPTYKNKYFKLYQPITASEKDGIPAATYDYLYIRRSDPYRSQVGDIDFVLPVEDHEKMKQTLDTDTFINGARLFGRPEENMIELWNPDVDVLPYVATEYMRDTIERENSLS
jgi:hypothetical protein